MIMDSIFVPVLYVVVVFGSLFVFSHFYRQHNASKVFEPYFPSHPERNAYVTLLQKSDPPAHDALLKSALVRRAMTDVNRVMRLREDKPALQSLLQKGSIGDDLWNSLLAAEKELEAEIMEVVAEANTFVEGWGSVIFQTASEVIVNERMRSILDRTAETRAEKEKKYERRTKAIGIPPPISLPSPGLPSSSPQLVVPSNSPASADPVAINGVTMASSSSSKSIINETSTPHGESTASSEGEAHTTSPSSTAKSQNTPKHKKGKKRK